MEKVILMIIACFCMQLSTSQVPMEYIPNGDFENFKEDERKGWKFKIRKAEKEVRFAQLRFWENPTNLSWPQKVVQKATPDFCQLLDDRRPDDPYARSKYGWVIPFDNSVAGIMVFNGQSISDANYREYLTIKLRDNLEVNKSYTIRFQITNGLAVQEVLENYGKYGITNLGLLLSKQLPIQQGNGLIKSSPQIIIKEVIYLKYWKEFVLTIKADQPYAYLTIGNFNDDYDYYRKTNESIYQVVETNNKKVKGNHCYYFFDNFSLKRDYEADKEDTASQKEKIVSTFNSGKLKINERELFPCGRPLVLPNLLFDKDKSTFRKDKIEAAYEELDKLYKFVSKEKELVIEVSGHTQNIQDPASRDTLLSLSEARARTAMEYLVKKGIDRERIIAVGLGPDYPIDLKNDEVNRRVVVKFLCDENGRPNSPVKHKSSEEESQLKEKNIIQAKSEIGDSLEIKSKKLSLLIIEKPGNEYTAEIGQEIMFEHVKQMWVSNNLKIPYSIVEIGTPYIIEEIKADLEISNCGKKVSISNDWYKIYRIENGEKQSAWVCGLGYCNSRCY